MAEVIRLQEAIVDKFVSETCLTDITCHGEASDIDPAESRIGIGSRGSNTHPEMPFIGVEIVDTNPLVRDDPATNWYHSLVFVFCTANDELTAREIAGLVSSLLSRRPAGESRGWFYDFSNDCIFSRDTLWVSNLRFGREGQNKFNHETDQWLEVVEFSVKWSDCPCNGFVCEPPVKEVCEYEDSEEWLYEDDCNC